MRSTSLAALAVVACSSSGTTAPSATAANLTLVSGSAQLGTTGEPLAKPLVVRVTNSAGQPVAGQTVSFSVTSGGGVLKSATVLTDAHGDAQDSWTLGSVTSDSQRVTASIATTSKHQISVAFAALAASRVPVNITSVAGDTQVVGGLYALVSPRVNVTDSGGHPVFGVKVVFTVMSPGSSISADTVATAAPPNGAGGVDTTQASAWTQWTVAL